MKLRVNDFFFISDIERGDRTAFVEHLQEKQIYDQTLNIPYPYSLKDADDWVEMVEAETKRHGRSINWAIRREDGFLVGGIGFHGLDSKNLHRAELGYWLARPYWNRGIMTQAVKAVAEYGFSELGLIRITAHVFESNGASARALQKSGFQLEGHLRKHYRKEDKLFDGMLFAKIKETPTTQKVILTPVGNVRSTRTEVYDDHWDAVDSFISLDSTRFANEALEGLTKFSHVEIIFFMDQVPDAEVSTGARFPRGNTAWGKVGIFGQRAKGRPNKLGTTVCKLRRIEGLNVYVDGLDAIDGTPVLDIKPWVKEFGPRGPMRQPQWISELMKAYWK